MKKSKSTKRALLASALSMLLCLAMLIGSTFAWFTDSVTSGLNKIVAGNLDVELEYKPATVNEETGEVTYGEWTPVNPEESLFMPTEGENATLWEPGHTEVVYLRVHNVGTLALQYQLSVGVYGSADGTKTEKSSKNVNNEKFKLSEHLVFNQKDGAEIAANRSDLWLTPAEEVTRMGKLDTLGGIGTLKPTESKELTLAVYMPTQVDNVANYKKGERIPTIFLGLNLKATQTPHEKDSFGSDYDDGLYLTADNAAFTEKLQNANPGDTVFASSGTYKLPATIPEGVTISGDGTNNTILKVPATPDAAEKKTGLVIDQPGVTISNAEIKRDTFLTSDEYYGFIDIREGGTTLDGIKINRTYANTSAIVIKNGVDEGETVRIANSSLKGDYKTINIVDGANGTVEIDNTEITGVYTFNVNSSSSQNLVINVTNSKLHGWTSYGIIKSANFTNTEFSMGSSDYDFLRPYADTTLTNCTFDGEFKLGAGDAGAPFTITINNCTYNGTPLTAENVQMMLDSDEEEMTNLKNWATIIVNGETVTIS